MRKTLLNYICCPFCHGTLDFITKVYENREKNIQEGILICQECNRWFPVRNYIPELLPDHLRNWEADENFLYSLDSNIEKKILKKIKKKIKHCRKNALKIKDSGVSYKKSEISIKKKVSDPNFFGPGYFSPFNHHNTDFTMQLIRRFGNAVPLLNPKQHDIILDVGCGYAWTTEWLKKMGTEPIGIDICRTYLDIGIERMGKNIPPLIVADTENLPIKKECVDAILCYDAFHHIPDRKKAMSHFNRTLKTNGNIVLIEPGLDHEAAAISQEVMKKYGLLEKGMSLSEVKDYCENLTLLKPQQHFIIKCSSNEQENYLSPQFIQSHSFTDEQIFVINKINKP